MIGECYRCKGSGSSTKGEVSDRGGGYVCPVCDGTGLFFIKSGQSEKELWTGKS